MFWTKKETISDDDRDTLLETVPCLYCGGWHSAECMRVREVHLDASGKVLSAKFWEDWDKSTTIFRHELEADVRVSLWRRWVPGVRSRIAKVANKVQDVLWTSSYISWASRAVVFVATLTVSVLLVLAMVALLVHATGWLSFK